MSDVSEQKYIADQEIDFKQIWFEIVANRMIFAVVTTISLLLAVLYIFVTPPIYRSEALLSPVSVNESSSQLLNQLGSAAGILGVNVSSGSNQKIVNAIATLKSRVFLLEFIEKYSLSAELLASKWDETTNTSEYDEKKFDGVNKVWLVEPPSIWDSLKILNSILKVSEDPGNGLITVSIEWQNPVQAKQWVNLLISDINSLIKKRDLNEAQTSIEYLQRQLNRTQLVEMQQVLYQIIESQTRIVMLADVNDEYVFQVIDPAIQQLSSVWPNKQLLLFVGFLIGIFSSITIIFLKRSYITILRSN